LSVAVAAVTCGRLTRAAEVEAARGPYNARADKYGVNVTVSDGRSSGSARDTLAGDEVVLEHWGGDAEMLAFDSIVKGPALRSDPFERARVAARTMRTYDLDSLIATYANGSVLKASRDEVVLRGPRRGRLGRRGVVIRAALGELL
jgi:hypothetical protein